MRLVIESGAETGQAYELVKDRVAVGRGIQNDVVLSDLTASRSHCLIHREASGWSIEDVGSSSGTFVNGQRVYASHPLQAGDTVRIGQTTLRLEVGESVPNPPPAPAPAYDPIMAEPIPPRNSSSALWVLILGAIFVLVLIVGAILFLVLNPSTTQIAGATKSPMPTFTSVFLTTATPTLAVTETVQPVGIITSSVPDPNATRTAIPTPRPTETPLRTYTAPDQLQPKSGDKFTTSDPVPFQWIAVGALGPQELYRVQVYEVAGGTPRLVCEIRTRETFVTAPGPFATCNDRWQFNSNYRYAWRVQVVVSQANGNDLEESPIPQQSFEFSWAPVQ